MNLEFYLDYNIIPLDPNKPPIKVKVAWDRWGNVYAQGERLYTPYELLKRFKPITLTMNQMFKLIYGPIMSKFNPTERTWLLS